MRILIVADVLGEENNGTTIAAMNLVRYLKAQGEDVRILCADQDKKGVPGYFVVPNRTLGPLNFMLKKNQVTLAKPKTDIILKALEGIDIVHSMLPFDLGTKTVEIARSKGIPATSGFHCQAENYSAHILNFINFTFYNNHIYKKYYNRYYSKVNAIHYPTEFIHKVFEHAVKRKTNAYVISNGVNEIYVREKVERKPEFANKFNILFIGRISKEKSHPVLIKAASLSKYKDQIQLIFAGKGPRENKIRKLEKKYNLNPIMMNFYSRKELVNIINSCDLYVHPSEIEIEAISCLEAIKCGLVPVISDSERSATNAFALDEKNLFKNNDPQDLANKIDYWIEHPEEKEKYSERYLNYADNFGQNECMRQMHCMLKTYAKEINHTKKITRYYRDEINDDFALNGLVPARISSNFKYVHHNPIYKFFEFLAYFVLAKPSVWLINKIGFGQKFKNHLTVKKSKLKGAFIYANHTQDMADAYTPNLIFNRKNNIIVNPAAFSIPLLKTTVQMLGGIPLPQTLQGTIHFTKAIDELANKGQHITIYPEAHIWPYYTEIRPFVSGSFRYPVNSNKPVVVVTNTYIRNCKKCNKCHLVTHIDGPFYPDLSIDKKEAIDKLRNQVYETMVKRSKEAEQFQKYRYINLNEIEER